MLVLSRKIGETIIIAESIRITIISIRGRHVRIAIDAPEDHAIIRGELLRGPGANLAQIVPRRQSSRSRFSVLPDET